MLRVWIGRNAWHMVLAVMLALLIPAAAGAEAEDRAQFAKMASELHHAARYDEALAVLRRVEFAE